MSKRQLEDEKIIFAMMVSDTQEQACKLLNVGRNFISEKKKDPAFMAKYQEYKKDLLSKTSEQLLTYNLEAIKTLRSLLYDTNSAVQLGACKAVISFSKDYYLLSDLQKRIEELEACSVTADT